MFKASEIIEINMLGGIAELIDDVKRLERVGWLIQMQANLCVYAIRTYELIRTVQ